MAANQYFINPYKFGVPFSPSDLTGLELWLDASDSSTVLNSISPDTPATDGQAIRRWLDKSGNDQHANQTTGANQPLLDADGLNSKGVLTFDGINDFFTSGTTSTFNFLHNGTESLVVIVAKAGSSANPDAAHGFLSTGSNPSQIGYSIFYDDRSSSSYNDAMRVLVGSGSTGNYTVDDTNNDKISPQTFYILENKIDADNATAGNRSLSIASGSLEFGTNSNTASPSVSNSAASLYIGSLYGLAGVILPLDGAIAEVIICSDPNTANRENLRNYLASKWGITLA